MGAVSGFIISTTLSDSRLMLCLSMSCGFPNVLEYDPIMLSAYDR
jgi:hypothetical protein